jgi:hypothetical protein
MHTFSGGYEEILANKAEASDSSTEVPIGYSVAAAMLW